MDVNHIKQKFTFTRVLTAATTLLVLTAIIAGLNSLRAQRRDDQRSQDIQQLKNFLEVYRLKHGRYPESLDELENGGIGVINRPRDPLYPQRQYDYKLLKDGRYSLKARFER